jgi:hypothetical protein
MLWLEYKNIGNNLLVAKLTIICSSANARAQTIILHYSYSRESMAGFLGEVWGGAHLL